MNTQILSGHVSPETAYVVFDYPYGFRLRCKIRYWLEFKKGKGFRFCSQTSNPKQGHDGEVFDAASGTTRTIWNKPKASTYQRLGGIMLLADNGHVSWDSLNEYDELPALERFLDTYGPSMIQEGRNELARYVRIKRLYEAKKANGMDYRQAAREASLEVAIAEHRAQK